MKFYWLKFTWFLIVMMAVGSGYGCSCNMARTIKESVDGAPAIFMGTVLAEASADLEMGEMRAYTIKVKKIYKGTVRADTVVVFTNFSEARCGIQFKVNSKIIAFATTILRDKKLINENRFFETSLCTWSGPYKVAIDKQLTSVIGKR
ncbi:hypothetical protein [Spirosoma radiotolerans]|nr:hypothetical protein [Spirosoma radiotolerans]